MIFKNNKKVQEINFIPWDDYSFEITDPIISASKNIPEYWKKMDRFLNNNNKLRIGDNRNQKGSVNLGLKHCMPYWDAMTAGYHYVLFCDIEVRKENGISVVNWRSNLDPLQIRGTAEIPTPINHYNVHYSWNMYWGIKTPPRWSVLITHPLNRPDLPFTTVSGIVDYDKIMHPGNISFHIKENFEGIIPKGTPIFQIIPIKRENWKSKIKQDLSQKIRSGHDKKLNKFFGYYKKFEREDKVYE